MLDIAIDLIVPPEEKFPEHSSSLAMKAKTSSRLLVGFVPICYEAASRCVTFLFKLCWLSGSALRFATIFVRCYPVEYAEISEFTDTERRVILCHIDHDQI